MKTTATKILTGIILFAFCYLPNAKSQSKPVAALIGVESKGVIQDAEAVQFMLNLELEKVGTYSLIDKYETAEILKKNNIEIKSCFGRSCVVTAGKALKVDKVITGNIDRFGEKIIITLKVFDVKSEILEKSDVTEYLNLQPELQKMIQISVQKLAGIKPDPNIAELLINYEMPIESPKTQVRLNGPRMGASMTFGDAADVLTAKEGEGGFNMYPAMFNFGWQQEWQYLSSGNFQALIEGIFLLGGLESGKMIPSLSILNGFRVGKSGWEFAFGPSFRVIKKANGFFGDGLHGTTDGKWYYDGDPEYQYFYNPNFYSTEERLDSRGDNTLSTSLILAAGKTFKSGYLNIPVNVYVSPRKEGTIVGFSFGFNVYRKPKNQ